MNIQQHHRPGSAKAGWSEIEITPPLGIILGGRGMVLSQAEAVKAPLLGQVLALEDVRGKRLLLVSLDLIALSTSLASLMQLRLAAVAGVLPHEVILNCSHTHSGPMTHFDEYATLLTKPENLVRYEPWLVDQMALAAAGAIQHLAPASVHRHRGTSDIGINRRHIGPDGKVTMGPNPHGCYQPELFLLDVVQNESGARCLAFSYACHPVIEYGWAPKLLSPDFPGAARAALKERFTPATHTQFFQASCGNIRPRTLSDFECGTFRGSQCGDAEQVGLQLAQDVAKTLQTPPERLELKLSAAETWALVPKEMTAPLTRENLEAAVTQGGAVGEAARYWLECGLGAQEVASVIPWPIGLFSLAAHCSVAWFGGEPFAEWTALLRRELADPELIVWGYTGRSAGYLPMDEHLAEGGYETKTGSFRKLGPQLLSTGINAAITEAFLRLRKR